MKPKRFDKKLVMKKVTISDLNNNLNHMEQIMVRGGGTVWTRGCEDKCDIDTDPETGP